MPGRCRVLSFENRIIDKNPRHVILCNNYNSGEKILKIGIKLDIGKKAAILAILGAVALGILSFFFIAGAFEKIIMKNSGQKMAAIAGISAHMCKMYVADVIDYRAGRINDAPADDTAVNAIEAAAAREGVLYAALKIKDKTVIKMSAAGKNFKLPGGREISVPVMYMNKAAAELVLGFDEKAMRGEIAKARLAAFAISFSGALIFAGFIFLFIYFEMILPVRKISSSAKMIASGKMPDRMKETNSEDEIGALSNSFNEMTDYLTGIIDTSSEVSKGGVPKSFVLKSDDDEIGNVFKAMIDYLKFTSETLEKVAKGDISFHYSAKSEQDVLGHSIEDMLNGLRRLVTGVKKSSEVVAASAGNLTLIAEQSKETIVQLTETVTNISHATGESAGNSQAASKSSHAAYAAAQLGQKSMTGLLEKMQKLKTNLEMSTFKMRKLEGHSEEIKNMVEIIKSIADETKLLSLNAAIEAARAGQSGMGFAVVAEEIKKLSDLSTEQVKKISLRIKEVRDDISETVRIAAEEADEITESSALTEQANGEFDRIVRSIDETTAQVEGIAATSEEIAASSQEAAASSEEQSSAMQELATSAEGLSVTAKSMKEATDMFKV